jgi:hypothetical protein
MVSIHLSFDLFPSSYYIIAFYIYEQSFLNAVLSLPIDTGFIVGVVGGVRI